MRNSETRRRVRGDFANFGCGNRSVNASQPFDNPRDSWWAHQDSNLGPTDYESAALTAELWAPHRVIDRPCPPRSVGGIIGAVNIFSPASGRTGVHKPAVSRRAGKDGIRSATFPAIRHRALWLIISSSTVGGIGAWQQRETPWTRRRTVGARLLPSVSSGGRWRSPI